MNHSHRRSTVIEQCSTLSFFALTWKQLVIGCLLVQAFEAGWADLRRTCAQQASQAPASADDLAGKVQSLAKQLDAETLAERDAAEKELLTLGAEVLPLLPKITGNTSSETRVRLQRIIDALQDKEVDDSIEPSRVTLTGSMTVREALDAITEQTSNRFSYEGMDEKTVELDFDGVPFWEAVDELLDLAALDITPFRSDEGSIVLQPRSSTESLRIERAAYAGVFRIEPVEVTARKSLRDGQTNSLQLQVWVAWEPRLSPIFVQFKMNSFEVELENGEKLEVANPDESPEYSPTTIVSQMEIDLDFKNPERTIRAIKSVKGSFAAALPGKIVELEFNELGTAGKKVKEMGSLSFALEKVRKNGATYEFQTRVKLANAGRTMDSFRGWVLGNEAYLLEANNERIENAGSNTTSIAGNEVGMNYLFVVDKDIKNYRFIYKAPGAVIEQDFSFELGEIELP